MAYVVAQGFADNGKSVGPRYCQDGKNRFHAPWGTYPECAKVYRKKAWAEKRAEDQNRWATIKSWTVVDLDEYEMDAAGNIFPKEEKQNA